MVITMMSATFVSCSSDDDIENAGGGIAATDLVGKSFYLYEDDLLYKWNKQVLFISPYFAVARKWGKDYDIGTWNWGDLDCLYTVTGNKVVVYLEKDDGYSENWVLTMVNGKPEGWEERSWTQSKRILSHDSFDAKPGTADMFGYYAYDGLYKFWLVEINDRIAIGDSKLDNWERTCRSYSGLGYHAYHIIDENTIDVVWEYFSTKKPKEKGTYTDWTKTFTVMNGAKRTSITVYHYFDTENRTARLKYVMNGNKLVNSSSSDGSIPSVLIYEDGKLKMPQDDPELQDDSRYTSTKH